MSTTISILGNTGRDVDLRYTQQGMAVASFSIASNTFRNTPEGKKKKTDWFNVTAFGKVAETLAQNVRKGSHLLVRGRLTFNPWLSQNGDPRVGADVVLQDFEFAGGAAGSAPDESEAEELETTGAGPESPEATTTVSPDMAAVENGGAKTVEPFVNQF